MLEVRGHPEGRVDTVGGDNREGNGHSVAVLPSWEGTRIEVSQMVEAETAWKG